MKFKRRKEKLNVVGIIPARMESSRFPGKPMVKIQGIPMVGHVYYRSKMCKSLNGVCVATCNQEIMDYIGSIGGTAIMTSNKHERASDRAAEALVKMEKIMGRKADIAVMIQGDEPMLIPRMVDEVVAPLRKDPSILISNLLGKIGSQEEFQSPNVVKVVVDKKNFALYFSREPIPSGKKCKQAYDKFKQIAIIPFRRDFLLKFNRLTPTPLEIVESVDMMRVLEHGFKVKMVPSSLDTYSVDTPGDLELVQRVMVQDPLLKTYAYERGCVPC